MLTTVHIQNFRCLRDVKLELSPLTVFVGPNGSGKTAILDVLSHHGFLESDAFRHDPTAHMTRTVVRNHKKERVGTAPGTALPAAWSAGRLRLDPVAARKHNVATEARRLEPDGGNLANVFATLPRRAQEAVANALRDRVPLFSDLNVVPSSAGKHRLLFTDRWAPSVRYEPEEVSDGTMLLTAFLTLVHTESPPELLVIEEPERSLHPFLLSEVMDLLRALTTGELGAAIQVLVATHSPQILSLVQATEVRFVSRALDDGGTVVRSAPVDDAGFRAALEEHEASLGDLWLSGGLGGTPGLPI